MKISHTSDIHLEFMNFPDFSKEKGGDVLILNGDILVYNLLSDVRTDKPAKKVKDYLRGHFIPDLIEKYKTVLYVAGNHEFYRGDIKEGLDKIEDWFHNLQCDNMIFMENDTVDINGVRFIGATLWSDFLGENDVAMWEARRGMNDFHIISVGSSTFMPEDALAKFKVSSEYIKNQSDVDMPVVVFTHHAPHKAMLNKQHSGYPLDGAYYTDMTWLMNERPNIKYWVSGHTHAIHTHKVNETTIVSNCRGYYSELGFKNWTGLKHFEV